jgi:hypothetical protein
MAQQRQAYYPTFKGSVDREVAQSIRLAWDQIYRLKRQIQGLQSLPPGGGGAAVGPSFSTSIATQRQADLGTVIAAGGIQGGDIDAGAIAAAALTKQAQSFNTGIVFSATDHDTVQWTAADITFSDETTYSIGSGNTGTMSALTYIYIDTDLSTTVLQVTTTFGNTVGDNKILLCVAQNIADSNQKAFFVPAVGVFGINETVIGDNSIATGKIQALAITAAEIAANTITAAKIAALTITAAEIAATTITGAKMVAGTVTATQLTGTTLSALYADLGTITAGSLDAVTITGSTITGGTVRTSASGERVELTSANTLDVYSSIGAKIFDMQVESVGVKMEGIGKNLDLNVSGILNTVNLQHSGTTRLSVAASGLTISTKLFMTTSGDIDMGDNDIISAGQIELDSLISAATDIECYDSLVPNGTHDLGTDAVRWSNMYISSVVMSGAAVLEDRAAIAAQATHAVVHCVVNGSGKQELRCQFATGAVQVLATEP